MARYSKVVKNKKKSKLLKFVPEKLQVFMARRVIDLAGIVLTASGLFVLVSLASYQHTDPSLNTATVTAPGLVNNWLGVPGAYAADLLMQTIGLAGLMAGLILTVWGIRILRRQGVKPFVPRLAAMLFAVLTASIAFARVPAGDILLHPYLGGSGGTMLLDGAAAGLALLISGYEHTVAAAVAAALSLIAMLYAVAVTRHNIWAALKLKGRLIVTSAQFVMARCVAFYDWVRHYGDPDYETPISRKKIIKTPKKERVTPKVTADDNGPSEEAKKAVEKAIRVVDQKKSAKTVSSQTSFALDSSDWQLPTLDLIQEPPPGHDDDMLDEEGLRKNAELLQEFLKEFNVDGEIVSIHPGPVVTLYELEPAPGVKTSRVIGLSDDIARAMAAVSVRCAVIPGRNVIGIELPNSKRQLVYLREVLEEKKVQNNKMALPLILGKDIGGRPILADLAKMPHLLVAGTTGSGKSVGVNTMILSLLYRLPPEKCRFIMIDPKMLELSIYNDIPHLLSPVVTEPGKAVVSLKWAVQEMENRYRSMSKLGVRNIEGYNQRIREAIKKGETLMRKVQTGFDADTGKPVFEEQPLAMTELPYIVIVVDEFADLMLVAGKDVEAAVQRLAQMARAAGIHLIMATQRPSVDVITGIIKANFPTRISFQVTSKVDSRTILNEGGAEQLLGMGDMLYMPSGGRLERVHGPFVSDEDVEHVVTFLKKQGAPAYLEEVTEGGNMDDSDVMSALFSDGGSDVDDLYDEAVAIVARTKKASTSFIQRQLQIGYNRAARIIEAMEEQGVISPADHVGRREVLVSDFSDA